MLPSFELFGYTVFSYPLMMGIAWGAAFQISKRLNETSKNPLLKFGFFMTLVFLASWIGAKAFYLLTADFGGKEALIANSNFWLGGGFVFYGGLVFGLVFTLLFGVKTRQPMKKLNIFVPALAIGHGLGRIGCFLAGCCYGIPYEGVGAVHLHGAERFPVQVVEAAFLLLIGGLTAQGKAQKRPALVVEYLIGYALLRFGLEFLRGDLIRGVWAFGASSSQIISLLTIALLSILAFYRHRRAWST